MLPDLTITTSVLGWSVGALFALVLLLIGLSRWYLRREGRKNLAERHSADSGHSTRGNKYPEVDVLNWRGTFGLVGMTIVMLLAVLAFNWTAMEEEEVVEAIEYDLESDIEVAPPRTEAPPPPPPPPPPPVIEEVANDVLLEDDDIEFEDMSIDDKTIVDVPPPVLVSDKGDGPPPPPPPPPPKEPEMEEIFKVVEDMPRFPGCEDIPGTKEEKKNCASKKLMAYLYANLKYPQIARENGVEGTVVIRFVVNRTGKISNAEVLRDIGAGCGAEALRVVNDMNNKVGKWIPGHQAGRPVNVMFTLPVKFRLKVD